jgi:stearoyl-CoA desaturase (delta-9 desaturase)
MGALTGLLWGGLLRIFVAHHVTWCINSVCHLFGTRPFDTRDSSRNSLPLALLTFGEGWHNNHHARPYSARHGVHWWQIDVVYYIVCMLEWAGCVSDVKGRKSKTLAGTHGATNAERR